MAVQNTIPLRLAVGERTGGHCVFAKQGDAESRFLLVTLVSGEEQLVPETGTGAQLRAILPDRTPVTSDATVNDDGTILAEITTEMLTMRGKVRADIALIGQSGEILSSEVFHIQVQGAPTY